MTRCPNILTDGEAAEALRMLPVRLIRLARRGEVPCIILPDGDIRFDAAELAEWIDHYRRPATAGGAAR